MMKVGHFSYADCKDKYTVHQLYLPNVMSTVYFDHAIGAT